MRGILPPHRPYSAWSLLAMEGVSSMPAVHPESLTCMQDLSAQLKELASKHAAKEIEHQSMMAQMVRAQ